MGQGDHAMAVAADHGFGRDEGIDDGFFSGQDGGGHERADVLVGKSFNSGQTAFRIRRFGIGRGKCQKHIPGAIPGDAAGAGNPQGDA